jgi:hypothetical protein
MKSPSSGPLGMPCAALKAAIELNGLAWVPFPPAGAVLSMNQTEGPTVIVTVPVPVRSSALPATPSRPVSRSV